MRRPGHPFRRPERNAARLNHGHVRAGHRLNRSPLEVLEMSSAVEQVALHAEAPDHTTPRLRAVEQQ